MALRSHPVADVDLDACLEVALLAAKEAGNVIAAAWDLPKSIEHKGAVDLVTSTDKECEALIKARLGAAFPSHQFVGEETTAAEGGASGEVSKAPTWVVDPVDGTTNFVHRYPLSCVSIALAVGGEPVVGVVYNPIARELFAAVKARGATLNGFPLATSGRAELGAALFATELGTRRDEPFFDAAFGRIRAVAAATRAMRAGGSCALNLCGVAAGRLDAYFEYGLGGPWDYAAGVLIVREAGGHVLDPAGGAFALGARRVLGAATPALARDIAAILARCPDAPGEPPAP